MCLVAYKNATTVVIKKYHRQVITRASLPINHVVIAYCISSRRIGRHNRYFRESMVLLLLQHEPQGNIKVTASNYY